MPDLADLLSDEDREALEELRTGGESESDEDTGDKSDD